MMGRGGRRHWGRFSWFGLLMVVIGAWWLLGELGYATFRWELAGPLALILFGLGSLLRRSWWGGRYGCGCDCNCYEERPTNVSGPR